MFYLTTHSTHFIYGYMASDIWLRTILIARKETRCHHIGYSFRLAARVLLYAPSHRQDSTYHGLCYTSCGTLAFVLGITFQNQHMPNLNSTDSVYIQINFYMIKHTLFILTYSGSFNYKSQFYYICCAPFISLRYHDVIIDNSNNKLINKNNK